MVTALENYWSVLMRAAGKDHDITQQNLNIVLDTAGMEKQIGIAAHFARSIHQSQLASIFISSDCHDVRFQYLTAKVGGHPATNGNALRWRRAVRGFPPARIPKQSGVK